MTNTIAIPLYDVKRGSKIRIAPRQPHQTTDEVRRPPGDVAPLGDVITFHHLDGMYSLCTTQDGQTVHLAAWTEVFVVQEAAHA